MLRFLRLKVRTQKTTFWPKMTYFFFTFFQTKMTVTQLLLVLSGDVELNPGPPKRAPKAPEKKDPPKEENNVGALETKV